MIIVKSPDEIALMHKAGKIAAEVLGEIRKAVAPGVKTSELALIAERLIEGRGGRAAFLGYRGFTGAICVSLNNEVVHGIPGERKIQSGDLVSVDVGVEYQGYYGDTAATFAAGQSSPEAKKLVDVTRQALEAGIEFCRPGCRLFDISSAVQREVEANGFSVVRQYVGHGIGSKLHEDPQVPNFGRPGRGPLLEEGMVLAIEPMVNAGRFEVMTLSDNWTVVTRDGSLSAHFEHTVAITRGGPLVLTK